MRFFRWVFPLMIFVCTLAFAASNPIPLVNNPLVPTSAAPGGEKFQLTVNGTGFVSGAVVHWNGLALATNFINAAQLTAAVPAVEIAAPGTASVTVVNPTPGGGKSNVVYFPVSPARSTVILSGALYSTPGKLFTNAKIVTGDVNNDGKVDVIENVYSNNLAPGGAVTFLGNGDGTLQSFISSNGQCSYSPIALGDFNNDGNLDVAALDSEVGICIMLGNGDGTFSSGAEFANVESQPSSPVVADFNGDGNLDVAFAQGLSYNGISVYLGNGDGTLQPVKIYSSGFPFAETSALAVGDFNGDGKPDLVVGGPGLSILFGNGDGTFKKAVPISYGTGNFASLLAADFNGDGKLDLVASGENYGNLAVFLGNGDGTFRPEVDYPLFSGSYCSVAADLNNDGNLDVACNGGEASLQTVYQSAAFLGNGDGTFQPSLNFLGAFDAAWSVAAGDFNNDGEIDLAAGEYGGLNASASIMTQTTVQITPDSFQFPIQTLGTQSAKKNIGVTNAGSLPLDLSGITIAGLYASDFTQTNNCGSSIRPGGRCNIAVQFTPSSAQIPETASIEIADNAAGSPHSIYFSGTGTAESLTPQSVNFGAVAVGQSSAPQVVTLKNLFPFGHGHLELNFIGVHGANSGDFTQTNNCGTHLEGGQSCQITVTFTPTATGTRIGSVGAYNWAILLALQGTGD